MIKTSMAENNEDWDNKIEYINFVINTTRNKTMGLSLFEITFGRDPNLSWTFITELSGNVFVYLFHEE